MATWIKARSATILLDAIAHDWQEFNLEENYNEFDGTAITGTTNSAGALNEDFDVDVVSTSFNGSIILNSEDLKTIKGGRKYAASATMPDGEVHTGTVIITKRGRPVAARGGYKIALSGKFAGGVTGQ